MPSVVKLRLIHPAAAPQKKPFVKHKQSALQPSHQQNLQVKIMPWPPKPRKWKPKPEQSKPVRIEIMKVRQQLPRRVHNTAVKTGKQLFSSTKLSKLNLIMARSCS